jgi:hypothetical protein
MQQLRMTPQGVTWVFNLLIRVAQLEVRFVTYLEINSYHPKIGCIGTAVAKSVNGPEQGSIPIEIRVIELEF